jgi:hypothetical protein
MADNVDSESKNTAAFDPRFQTENLAFDSEKLLSCVGCDRMNPPNRLSCLYCGRALEIDVHDAASIKTNLRKLELWERGVNVILREQDSDIEPDHQKLASFLSMDAADVSIIIDAGTPLPLARVASEKEADILRSGLEQFGLKCTSVKDDVLVAERPPVRLSGMAITDGQLTLNDFNTGKLRETAIADLVLIVPGNITDSKVDSLETKGIRKKAQLTDQSASIMDEALFDIYLRNDPIGFRVRMAGFDFSCLGEDKGLLAGENMQRLVNVLKVRAPHAKLVDNYRSVRQALGRVWDIESHKDSKNVERAGFGKAKFGTVESTSNLNQFTKYSRLQWHLL